MSSLFGSPRPIPVWPRALPQPARPPKEVSQAAKATSSQGLRRRGRAGTIATSFRGVLLPQDAFPRRKQLLGE